LFSASVTAFAVEAFPWLEEATDPSIAILSQISLQIGNLSGIQPQPIPLDSLSGSSLSAACITTLWFLSLVLSLSAVLIGTLCLQWLREYQRDVPQAYSDALQNRRMRYDGLLGWRVPQIISALPLMLQVSVVLFFSGVFVLLWERNRVVAAVVLVPMFLSVAFLFLTTALPTFQAAYLAFRGGRRTAQSTQCPYKSPQAWIFQRIFAAPLEFVAGALCVSWSRRRSLRGLIQAKSWVEFDY